MRPPCPHGSTRAATSWCGACSSTIAPISSRRTIGGACLRCRLDGVLRCSGPRAKALPALPGGSSPPPAGSPFFLGEATRTFSRRSIPPAWGGSFAGVRSLYDDGSRKAQDVTRDYVLTLDQRGGEAPLLTIYGGKITTYRRLAEHALDRLAHVIAIGSAWTKDSHLPGGEFPYDS